MLVFSLFGVSPAIAAEQCPAINCDCASLPNQNWVSTCRAHEIRIKTACVANSNTPKDYCAIHGLNAKPLPLAMKLSSSAFDASLDTEALKEKISSLYWAIESNTTKALEGVESKRYGRSLKILKLIDSNVDTVFELEQQLTSAFSERKDKKKARAAWKKYARDTNEFAINLKSFGTAIYAKIASAESSKQKKIFSVLSQKTLRMAGKGFEHSGYAFGKTRKHKQSARTWSLAADIAKNLAVINKELGANKNNVRYAEFQAAARLHRASYHWAVNENTKDSLAVLKDSQSYLGHEAQKNLDALLRTESERENADEGILTRR